MANRRHAIKVLINTRNLFPPRLREHGFELLHGGGHREHGLLELLDGIPTEAVSAMLCHKDANVTNRFYSHWMPSTNAAAMEKMGETIVGMGPDAGDSFSGGGASADEITASMQASRQTVCRRMGELAKMGYVGKHRRSREMLYPANLKAVGALASR